VQSQKLGGAECLGPGYLTFIETFLFFLSLFFFSSHVLMAGAGLF
jgi:hypothetical protein